MKIEITPKQYHYFEDFKSFNLLRDEENKITDYEWNSIKDTDRDEWQIFQNAIDNIEQMAEYIEHQKKQIERLENLMEKLL